MKNFTYRMLSMAWLLFILLYLIACSKDRDGLPEMEKQGPIAQNDCRIALSYEITTYTYAQAYHPEEQEALTLGEQTLRLPRVESCTVEACILEDGQMVAEAHAAQPESAPEYPPGTIGPLAFPEESAMDKMVFSQGTITSYNAQGEPLAQSFSDGTNLALFQNIIEGLGDQATLLTTEQMSGVLESFVEAGFEVRPTENERIALLRHTFEDGSFSELVIDKELQLIRGQANFDVDGILQTKSYFSFTGEARKPVITGHTFVTYMDSPLSDKKMAIIKRSTIKNFNLEKNM
ncbi:MAG: hypothetical protein H6573_11265 [Lewinellaceae bacterium]|nr:hypothetical protein [Phaeodactylibacter sp.]MCB9348070.1 hypothetical protein [Lewinellaceae bacterium]